MSLEENLEEITVIWLDSQSYSTDTKVRLRSIVNFLKPFDNVENCFSYVSSIKNEKIFIITSGALCEAIVPLVHDLPQVQLIYIFCENKANYEIWSETYGKIHGVFVEQEALYFVLTKDVQSFLNSTSISFLNRNEKSIRDLNGTFYWYQLLRKTLLFMPKTQTAKQDLIDMARQQYVGNDKELSIIDDFDRNYEEKQAIRWYTRDSFLYRLLNKPFRTENIDLIFKFRFFIIDLQNQLQALHKEHIQTLISLDLDCLTVYRGQQVSMTEFKRLKDNIGGLMSLNSFLSTTTDKDVAMVYASNYIDHPQIVSVLFQIEIDLNTVETDSERPFACTGEQSYFLNENEILLSMSTVFRVKSIDLDSTNKFWDIKLTYIDEDDMAMKQLYDYFTSELDDNVTEVDFGDLLLLMSDFDRTIHYCKVVLDQKYETSLPNISLILRCYSLLGTAYMKKSCYELALQYYEASLELQLMHNISNTASLSNTYNNIGLAHRRLNSSPSVVREYYEKAFEIQQNSPTPNYLTVATLLNNMAPLMDTIEQSIEAYSKAIEIREKYLPLAHPLIPETYSMLGHSYLKRGDTSMALKCFENQMDRCEKYLPVYHPDRIQPYFNIGAVYFQVGDEQRIIHSNERFAKDNYELSLQYYLKGLDIAAHNLYQKDLSYMSAMHNNIGVDYIRLEDYAKALEHLTKAKEYRTDGYLGLWHLNMGKVFTKFGNFETGFEHYNQALEAHERENASKSFLIEKLYNNLGEFYEMKNDYENALINYEKALDNASMRTSKRNLYIVEYEKAIERVKTLMDNK